MEGLPPTFLVGNYSEAPLLAEDNKKWTDRENKIFENALAELDLSSPNLHEEIRARLPEKSIDQIKRHVEEFFASLAKIGPGKVPISNDNKDANPSSSLAGSSRQQKEKGARWTPTEHKKFLLGLDMYGKGNWSNISKLFIPSKNTSQVASHGQKYFRRLRITTPIQKRRCSIHDTRIQKSTIFQISARLMAPLQERDEPPSIPNPINHNSEANHYETVIPISSPMYSGEQEGLAWNSHSVNQPPPFAYNFMPNLYGTLTANDSNMSYPLNPPPSTEPDYFLPNIPEMSPMYSEVQGPPYISNLASPPPPCTYDNSDFSYTLNPPPSIYSNYEPYHSEPIIPLMNSMFPEEQQEPPFNSYLLNSALPSIYNSYTPNQYAPFNPITSPMYPEQEQELQDFSHLVNPFPYSGYNDYEATQYAASTSTYSNPQWPQQL